MSGMKLTGVQLIASTLSYSKLTRPSEGFSCFPRGLAGIVGARNLGLASQALRLRRLRGFQRRAMRSFSLAVLERSDSDVLTECLRQGGSGC
ncbi:hypothetical protein Pla52n_55170 [Stieleria varia]|uniref:Uncharacterized protein n=1 Tax=Stieleria varia TaxID=2528005 RepID=A0A5C6A452_9BACT|nr:hypothetical protein Pla52n_55170 [Stieleria varia]